MRRSPGERPRPDASPLMSLHEPYAPIEPDAPTGSRLFAMRVRGLPSATARWQHGRPEAA